MIWQDAHRTPDHLRRWNLYCMPGQVCDSSTAVILGHSSFEGEDESEIWVIIFKLPPLNQTYEMASSLP